ncbi:MAG: AAA domain-containing protein [Myxococcales bacterium]|nr:AAA domain-containing protein [Myxococcales bacterium]
MSDYQARVAEFSALLREVRNQIGQVIVGQQTVVTELLKTIFANGHALIEGVPGLGKTLLVSTLGQVFRLGSRRIQFTPDLMPADILGTNLIVEDAAGRKRFEFQKGPVFTQIVLADEINRATPKTQSALLQAMQERSVTVAGVTYELDKPFFVLATQNPIEMEGTYPLPEAQVDRFLTKILIQYPNQQELMAILDRTTGAAPLEVKTVMDSAKILAAQKLAAEVPVPDHVRDAVTRLVLATHPESDLASDMVKKYVRYGASPRGGQAMLMTAKVTSLMDNRYSVSLDDVKSVLHICMRHRLLLSFEGEAEGVKTDDILADLEKRLLK